MRRAIGILASLLVLAGSAEAQSDQAAGLFCNARQLPLVSQSIGLRVVGGEAELQLVQVFYNDGEDAAQADYRLHLPDGATIIGFGFRNEGELLEAKLREKSVAVRAHAVAAAEGRATTLLRKDSNIHSFSVYPVLAGEKKKIETRLLVPIERDMGRYRVRIPVADFLGQSPPSTSVVVDLDTEEPLTGFGLEKRTPHTILHEERRARLTTTSRDAVELWWTERGEPLLLRAEGVPLDDGSFGFRLRAALNDAGGAARKEQPAHVLIDASRSMRRRLDSIRTFLERIESTAAEPTTFHTIAESVESRGLAEEALDTIAEARVGHHVDASQIAARAESLGCLGGVRCVVLADPQIGSLELLGELDLPVVLLADVGEQAHFRDHLPDNAWTFLPGVEPDARLVAHADLLVRPVLQIDSVRQNGHGIALSGRPLRRVAEGGLLRLFGRVEEASPLEVHGTIDGVPFAERVPLTVLDVESAAGRTLCRCVWREVLGEWTERYRETPDEELRQRIVEVSVREGIPTELTAMHVAAPGPSRLPKTATSSAGSILLGLVLLSLALTLVRLKEAGR